MEKRKSEECEVYDKVINIDLFNKIVLFIVSTSQNKERYEILRKIKKDCIWVENVESEKFQEEYKFEYLGELLERYEERIGNNIKDVRAIVLALGYASKLIESNMIIGTQLIDFLNKVKNLAENDIYLQGALYLYDNQKYSSYAENFIKQVIVKTEELIFILSVLNDDIENVFIKKKSEIIDLLGKNRNLSIFGNIKVYAWLVRQLYPLVNNSRKKEFAGIKALVRIPKGFQKEDTPVYKDLIQNGYSKEEIAYLNYLILYYDTVPDSIPIGNSIVEEKIAINLCEIFIGSEKSWNDDIYALISDLFAKYSKFNIKCYGYKGIKEALIDKIDIVNPVTFLKMYEIFDKRQYSFNILDDKWDILATEFNSEEYQELFDNFLMKIDKDQIIKCIERYNKMIGQNYIESFLKGNYYRNLTFDFLVNNNVIILEEFFNKIIENNENKYVSNRNFEHYIECINNKKSYEFLKYLLTLNKYSIVEINSFGFSLEKLYQYYGESWSGEINIQKEFLNIEEQKFLFNCLEMIIFYNFPERYINFLSAVIESDFLEKIISKESLRKIYFMLCDTKPGKYEKEYLRKKYFTENELNEFHEQERIQKEKKEQEKLVKMQNEIIGEFQEIQVKTFEGLYEFCKSHKYDNDELEICKEVVYEYILKNINTFEKENKDIIYLNKTLLLFMTKELLTTDEFVKIFCEYMKEEVIKYGNNIGTCYISNQNV